MASIPAINEFRDVRDLLDDDPKADHLVLDLAEVFEHFRPVNRARTRELPGNVNQVGDHFALLFNGSYEFRDFFVFVLVESSWWRHGQPPLYPDWEPMSVGPFVVLRDDEGVFWRHKCVTASGPRKKRGDVFICPCASGPEPWTQAAWCS